MSVSESLVLPFQVAAKAESMNRPFAVVTLVETKGRVPRRDGRMVVLGDGSTYGTIGGGEAERQAAVFALECIEKGKGGMFAMQVKESGSAKVFVDVPVARRKAVIVGTGHVAMALGEELHRLSFEVVFVDDWNADVPQWASLVKKSAILDGACSASCDSVCDGVDGVAGSCPVSSNGSSTGSSTVSSADGLCALGFASSLIDDRTAVLFSNPDDVSSLLPSVLGTNVPFIGILASRKRPPYADSRVHMPMGLDIGVQTPAEIAVAVAAQVMSVLNGRTAEPSSLWKSRLVVVRGAGDLATAVGIRLHKAGFDVVHLEVEKPTVIRRTVSFASAMFDGTACVEGVVARRCSAQDILHVMDDGEIPIVADPECNVLGFLSPVALVDAIIAKRNLGTHMGMAPFTIALGPGFEAGKDVDAVVETQRGHRLGVVIKKGFAAQNTGIPGVIGGYGKERVMHSPAAGVFRPVSSIGDIVEANQTIAYVDSISSDGASLSVPVVTTIAGKVRGMLHDGLEVPVGFKVADVDPRGEATDHLTCSDKARAISGSVLEAIMSFLSNRF